MLYGKTNRRLNEGLNELNIIIGSIAGRVFNISKSGADEYFANKLFVRGTFKHPHANIKITATTGPAFTCFAFRLHHVKTADERDTAVNGQSSLNIQSIGIVPAVRGRSVSNINHTFALFLEKGNILS